MKSVILLLLIATPFLATAQTENEKSEKDKQKERRKAQNEAFKKQKEYRANNFPDSLYLNATVLVLTEEEKNVDKYQKKYNKIFDGNIKVVCASVFKESDYPIEEYPFIIIPTIRKNMKAATVSNYGYFIITGKDRMTGKKYVQSNLKANGELYYVRTWIRQWNAKANGEKAPIFGY